MKNLFKNLMLVAVAAMGFTACEQVIDDVNATNEKFTVNIVGEFADDTRSGFDGKNDAGTGYKSAWDGEETVRFAIIPDTFGDSDKATYVDVENESEGNRATFAPTFDSNEGTIHAFSPKGVYDSTDASACKGGFTSNAITLKYENAYVVVPAEQTPRANSVDPAAHILAGKADFAANVNMTFNHVVAYGKMTIKNFAGKIDKVEITASEPLAGISCKYYYNEGELNNANVKTITLNADNVEGNVFWFGCAPADLSDGTLTVKVYSGEDTYTKELAITGKTDENGEKIEFQFQQGHVASFGVNMAGIEADVKEEVVDPTTLTYTLVTDVANLAVGDKVIIVAKETDVAMSTNQKTNNRGQVTVTKNGNTIAYVDDLQILTLEAGKTSGTFAFNTGSGYLYAASSSENYLRTETTLSANSSWSITIADGIATVKAQGTNTHNWMRYNQSSTLFSCYSSGQKDICIYKGVEAGTVEPEEPGGGDEPEQPGGGDEPEQPGEGGDADLGASYSFDVTETIWKSWGTGVKCGSYTWVPNKVSVNGSPAVGNKDGSGRGQQFGAKDTNQIKTMTMTCSDYTGGIKSLDVKACARSGNTVTVTVTVGGTAMNCASNSATISGSNSSSIKTFNFTSGTALSGEIVITYTIKTAGALYVSGFAINNN